MASTASPLKQAGELGREAEEAAANGLFEEAAHKYLLAAQFFTDATKHTADVQMIQSLTLLAQTHRQRAEELQFYLEAARALQESGGDPFYQGSSLTYSTGYDDEDEDYEDDDEDYGVAGTRRDGAQQPGDGSAHLGGPSYWEGEEMVYARSSSPSSDPLLFVFTKDDARPVAESQFYEIDHSRLPEPSPGSGGGSGEDVELLSTWQRMFMGLDKLLDILPRSTIPTASQAVDGDMGHAVLVDGPDADVAGGGNSGSHNPAAESFVLVPSRSPSPEVDSSSGSASSPKAMTGSGLLDYAQVGREDLVRELQRLSQTVEFLRGENAALLRAQEERREAKRENDMLKESILRFRREFERQTHHAKSTVPLSKSIVGGTDGHGGAGRRNAGGHPLAHSTIGHHKGQAHHRGLAQPRPSRPRLVQHAAALGGSGGSGGGSGRSLSSSSMMSRSSTASPPSSSSLLASSTCASSSSSSISSSPAPSSLSALAGSMSTSVSTTASPPPLSASTFWIQGLQMKRLKELEERNRALNQQLKQLRKQVAAGDRRIVALEDENRRQRETIDKYDERWKRLERSAREKMKQRQQSLSRTSSTPAATSTSSTSPPSSSKSSSAAMAIPGSLSEGQRGLLPMLAIPALASSPSSSSSPLSASPSSSPSSSFLMQAASSSLLSPSSSLFLRASSIGDDVREQ